MNEDLLAQTIALLRASPAPMHEIAHEVGVSLRWLAKLKAGQFKDPGFRRVVRLHRYLQDRVPEA